MKIGLFGGTFDPVHNAHLFVAEAARVELGLERMIFLPTRGAHYRTPPVANVEDRLSMLQRTSLPDIKRTLLRSLIEELPEGSQLGQ